MAQYYTDKLDRFYTKFNISARDAASMLASDWKKSKILSGNIDADWESLEVARTARHTYEVKMNADYHLVREEKNKPSLFHLALVIEMTKDLKIQSIYEDILSSDYDSGDESVNRFPMAAPAPPPPPPPQP